MEQEQDPQAEPVESGVVRSQKTAAPGADSGMVPSKALISDYALSDTLQGVTDPRLFKGVAMELLAVHVRSKEAEIVDARRELGDLRFELKQTRADLAAAELRGAVFEERLRANSQHRIMRNVLTTLGGILVGAGLSFLQAQQGALASVAVAFGAVMLLVGWLLPERGAKDGGASR